MNAALAQALGPVLATPLGRLLVALVAIAVVVLIGRIVLRIAWKLVVLGVVVVAVLYGLSLLGP